MTFRGKAMNLTTSKNGRDRQCRPINRDPHSLFPLHLYEVGKVDSGDHGKAQEKHL
jgi:hypothetical protein